MPTRHPLLDLHPEVAAALAAGQPVVALASPLISHGMPWPQNAETGRLKAGLTRPKSSSWRPGGGQPDPG